MENVFVLRISKPRKDGTDKVTLKLVEDAQDAALVAERRSRKSEDESYTLVKFQGEDAKSVALPDVSYSNSKA